MRKDAGFEVTDKINVFYKTEFEGDTFEFALDDLLISTESAQGFTASSDMGITVVMDTVVTEELKAEGIEREIISKIQSMRKEAGFEVTDRIEINVTASEKLIKLFTESSNIANVVLADKITVGEKDGFTKELDANGEKCKVTINKI